MTKGRIFVLLLTVQLAIPALSGSAQTPAPSGTPVVDQLAGIEHAVTRGYVPAGTVMGQGTVAQGDTTSVSSAVGRSRPQSIAVLVRAFGTAEHAASAFEQITAHAKASVANAGPDSTVTTEALQNIGAQATRIRLVRTFHFSELGLESEFRLENAIVQRDQYVFFVTASKVFTPMKSGGDDVDTALPTVAIAAAVAEGEPSPEEPTFESDGTSTGGLWGFMLPTGDPLLKGLVPWFDSVVYPPTPPPGAVTSPAS